MSALVLYRNGSIYSSADPFATAMLVEDGTVAWVGSEAAAAALHDSRMDLVDLDGGLVAPAFFDSHVHLTETGAALASLDLTGARSLVEVLDAVARRAAAEPGPVLGSGWDQSMWPQGRVPTAAELENAAGGRDVYLTRVDVHSGLVNASLAARLHLADVDGWDGDATVVRAAHAAVREAVLDFSTESRSRFQRRALRHLASHGTAGAAEMAAPHIGGRADLEALLALLDAEGGQYPEVHAYWGEAVATPEAAHALADSFGPGRLAGLGGDLNVDGSLGSRTARLRRPYDDDPGNHGTLYLDAEAIAAHLAACTQAGVQSGFHVIGDAGIDEAVAGFRLAAQRVGLPSLQSGRHRLEHVEMADADAISALLEFGVTVSMQPAFDALWGGPGGQYEQRLGDRAAGMNAVGRFLAAGVPVCLGSDTPVTRASPWAAVKACLEHHAEGARVSARAAFLAHSRAGYRAVGQPRPFAGQLAPGAEATFAVWQASELAVQTPDDRVSSWSTDARAGTPMLPVLDDELPVCLRTVRAGKVIHDALEQAVDTPTTA